MLDTKQLKAIELMIIEPDMSDEQLAKACGVSRQSIYNWKNKEEFQTELKRQFDETWRDMAKKAQKRMYELMDSPNDSVALGASKYVMDSYGRGAEQRIDITSKGKTLFARKV